METYFVLPAKMTENGFGRGYESAEMSDEQG